MNRDRDTPKTKGALIEAVKSMALCNSETAIEIIDLCQLQDTDLKTWVSVKDRLPPIDTDIMYWFEPFKEPYFGQYDGVTMVSKFGFCDLYDAPYWMPLPSPPVQDKD